LLAGGVCENQWMENRPNTAWMLFQRDFSRLLRLLLLQGLNAMQGRKKFAIAMI
jgi:hypothetical protein